MAATFIRPTSASTAISAQQHPRHHAPCSAPARRSRSAAGPAVATPRSAVGEVHWRGRPRAVAIAGRRPPARRPRRRRCAPRRPTSSPRSIGRMRTKASTPPRPTQRGNRPQTAASRATRATRFARSREWTAPRVVARGRDRGQHHRRHHGHPHGEERNQRHAHGAGRVAHHRRIRERPAPRECGNDEQRDPAWQGLARFGVHALYATSAMNALDMP